MGLNTYPYSPFPASTEQLHKGDNEQIQAEIDQLKSGFTTLDNEVNGDATTYPYADVITIEDAVPANVADCKVKIEPVQDLHGYDKPWVGGAGKNKLSNDLDAIKARNTAGTWVDNVYSYGGINYTYNGDGTININGTLTGEVSTFCMPTNLAAGNYLVNGMVLLGANTYMQFQEGSYWSGTVQSAGDLSITSNGDSGTLYIYIRVNVSNATVKPMIRLATETDATFAPYTNICPITGHTEASVEVTDGDETTKTYTIALGDTIYGGTVDFDSGVMTVTMAQIASYDGETIGEPWISDRDVYSAGMTPTTGAQVVYTLSESTTVQLTPQQIQLLKGVNTLTASTGDISVSVNGVSGSIGSVQTQANDTNEALAELAADIAEKLPTAPTTDGAYVLTVTVASGTPTYSWESAS